MGRILSGMLRRTGDLAARLDGDLFAVLLPTTDRIGVERVVDRLAATAAAEWDGDSGAVTIGMCSLVPQSEEDNAEAMMAFANAALRGENRPQVLPGGAVRERVEAS